MQAISEHKPFIDTGGVSLHAKVKSFIERKEQEKAKEREQQLIALGLFEKEYSDERHPDYPNVDPDTGKYYRIVPIEVTDEEYDMICSYAKEGKKERLGRNSVASALKTVAWLIIIIGIVVGLITAIGSEYIGSEYDGGLPLTIWLSAIIAGVLFLGFAEVIILLQTIANKMD
jgi:hypothetical protein